MSERDVPLKVSAADILPIIKRFMYSEREIFLRELISNALDALEKFRKVALVNSDVVDVGEPLRVEVSLDPVAKTVTIADNGIGMSGDEVIQYINQIAVSGASDFLEKYADEAGSLIGRFGLGFYSSFMVSKTVEIVTRSWKPEAGGCRWRCDGGEATGIDDDAPRDSRGTSVICHLEDDEREFLDPQRVEAVVRRFLDFAPFPIFLTGRQVNVVTAPWHMSSAERDGLPRERYWSFYQRLHPDENQPLGWFHIENDLPIEVRALLFLPERASGAPGNVRMFANRTFVCDHCRELFPEWLGFLDGVVDSPDIPLNVARDRFQRDPKVAQLRKNLTAKTLDFLAELLKTRRADYMRFWERCGSQLKYGYLDSAMHGQDRLCEKLERLLAFPSSRKPLTTLAEYLDRAVDSSYNGTILYLTDVQSQQAHLELQRNRNREVLYFTDRVDPFLVQALGEKRKEISFARIDQLGVDREPPAMDSAPGDATEAITWDSLTQQFREAARGQVEKVTVEPLPSRDILGVLRVTEAEARVGDLHRVIGRDGPGDTNRILVINSNCRLIETLGRLGSRVASTKMSTSLVVQVWDNIRLHGGFLEGDQLVDAVRRSGEFLTLVANELAEQIGGQRTND